ncbi:MAG TPA: exosortase A [Verrucomicrobiae bacterium]|nr:exosortase A [Verrucomicrobiae bacterium]
MNQLSKLALVSDETLLRSPGAILALQALLAFALVAWLYSSILLHLVLQWHADSNFSYGFLVPAFSAFVLWKDRSRLLALPRNPSSWGLLLVALAQLVLVLGVLGAELFLARVSLLFLIAGLVVVFLGTNHLRAAWFPLAFLLLMIPFPALVFNELTFPLQQVSSRIAAGLLPLLGVPVLREGNIINLPTMSLEVADACSGIRSLLSLITLAVIYGYLTHSSKRVRIALLLAAVPIAVFANSLRIVVTGVLVQYWSPGTAEGFFHSFSGWLVFLVSLAMLILVQQALTGAASWRPHGHN